MPVKISLFLVVFYQKFLSPYLGGNCRYYPSCSEYSIQCFKQLGFFWGIFYSTKRVCRCHPLASSGYDPVPDIAHRRPKNAE